MEACGLAGISVPDEMSILGIDNTVETCENTTPTLSSIVPNATQSGWFCADLLCDRLAGKVGRTALRHYSTLGIIQRESTRTMLPSRQVVKDILRIIDSRACEGLTVADIISELSCSRRTAECQFREVTGKSIKEAISEIRLARVKVLLSNPLIPIGSIAAACGYGSDVALRIAFRSYAKMSLSEWRRLHARPKG